MVYPAISGWTETYIIINDIYDENLVFETVGGSLWQPRTSLHLKVRLL